MEQSSEAFVDASGRTKLLLVDDDQSFLEFAQELGRRQLVRIVGARSASEAVDRARSEGIQGAIIDVWLGSEAAYHLARELCDATGNPQLPIAFVSGDVGAINRAEAARAGATLFLPKPLSESQLSEAVNQLMSARNARGARVLVVESDPARRNAYASVVSACGFRTNAVADATSALSVLDSAEYDAILMDARARQMSGVDFCRVVRTNLRWQDLSVLLVGPRDADLKLEAIQAGADDYIADPVDSKELQARLKARIERRNALRARLERDGLTGLALRRAFMESLRSRVSEAHRRHRTLAVCLLDLDNFKLINDRHGHLAGDRVLANLGRLLATDFREEDLRARWGGEEFALAFPGETASSIQPGIEDLLSDFRSIVFFGDGGEEFSASFSAGLSEFPLDGTSSDALIRAADERLYAAKKAGRNRVVR